MPITKLLIANRGEIAIRIMRTARRLGIATVAVYSDADREALHVREADQAIRIGPPPAADSYLNIPAILAAAATSGADAVHPGYGFLSENAVFAQAVIDAGLIWVGPTPEAIRRLGSKIAAKKLAQAAEVPTVPGYWPASGPGDPTRLAHEARRIGFPVLIKASAGGGGKGMRVVHAAHEFLPALEGAQREAQAAFGDPTVFLERYLTNPRHIEIQVIGDQHGTVLHLGERECSIQRRHQKVLEESPSPAPQMTPAKRVEMGAHAVALARAAGYTNAGTVEFIMDAEGHHYFLEVNTRLQVEHPVTEMVTGIDLVEWQLLVAQGAPLPAAQEEIQQNGHAIEVRIYAEDAIKGFLPSIGRLTVWQPPAKRRGPRLDSGVDTGGSVPIYYDPMLAKMIVHKPTRDEAVKTLAEALAIFQVEGVTTNLGFLFWLVQHPEFQSGDTDTGFIDRYWHPHDLTDPLPDQVAVAVAAHNLSNAEYVDETPLPYNPWRVTPSPLLSQEIGLTFDYVPAGFNPGQGSGHEVEVQAQRITANTNTWHLHVGAFDRTVTAVESNPGGRLRLRLGVDTDEGQEWSADGVQWSYAYDKRLLLVLWEGRIYRLFRPRPLSTDTLPVAVHLPGENHLQAPMPGKIIQVPVQEGQTVVEGDRLVVMEAMKMEFTIRAPHTGRVARLPVQPGQLVDAGTVLVEIE